MLDNSHGLVSARKSKVTKAGNTDRRSLRPVRPHDRKPLGMVMAVQQLQLPSELNDVLVLVSEQTGHAKTYLVREAVAQWAYNIGIVASLVDNPITNYRIRKEVQ